MPKRSAPHSLHQPITQKREAERRGTSSSIAPRSSITSSKTPSVSPTTATGTASTWTLSGAPNAAALAFPSHAGAPPRSIAARSACAVTVTIRGPSMPREVDPRASSPPM
jgi:hypothetical protein